MGAHPWVALAVPGALDLYVIRALQVRRDVFVAVLAMVAANVTWYLVHSGDLPIEWWLRGAVAAIAPLVVWRVHSLKYTAPAPDLRNEEPSADAGAVSAPEEYTAPAPECTHVMCQEYRTCQVTPDALAEMAAALAGAPAPECPLSEPFLMDLDHECSECGQLWGAHPEVLRKRAEHAAKYDAPEYVPADWSADPVPYLRAVPALAPDFDPVSAVHSFPDVVHLKPSALRPGDEMHLAGAQEYLDNCALTDTEPSVRGLRKAIKVGQDRADRLMEHLQHEEEL
jgi:hypothetical protein